MESNRRQFLEALQKQVRHPLFHGIGGQYLFPVYSSAGLAAILQRQNEFNLVCCKAAIGSRGRGHDPGCNNR